MSLYLSLTVYRYLSVINLQMMFHANVHVLFVRASLYYFQDFGPNITDWNNSNRVGFSHMWQP